MNAAVQKCSGEVKQRHLEVISRCVGGQGWIRTTDTGIFSPLLYRLSYRGIFMSDIAIAHILFLATRMGLEPTTSSVTG